MITVLNIIFALTAILYAGSQRIVLQTHSIASDEILQVGDPGDCNQTYHKQTIGLLSSPFYPLGYPDGTNCNWNITMNVGERIALVVKSFFLDMNDYLEIGESENPGVPQRYSMINPPPEVIFSNDRSLTVKLVSGAVASSPARYISEGIGKNRTFHALFEREGCGGVTTSKEGFISVPSYIHDSPLSHECLWTILAPPNQIILLQFIQFDLPPGSCLYSNIYIRDGDKRSGELVGSFCEENPPLNELRSSTNMLHVQYRSRPNLLPLVKNLVPKVKLLYRVADMCGGKIGGFSGTLAGPKRWLDGVYACNWTVSVPAGNTVVLKLHSLELLENSSHDYDSLTIYDFDANKTILWSSDKNSLIQQPNTSTSNTVIISLKSHGQASVITRLQFLASFRSLFSARASCHLLGSTRVFTCEDGHYIDCTFKCDGIHDCRNGADEQFCPVTRPKDDEVQKMSTNHVRVSNTSRGYSTFLLFLLFFTLFIVLIMLFAKRALRGRLRSRKQYAKYQHFPSASIRPPPYSEVDDKPATSFPPPYSECSNSNSTLMQQSVNSAAQSKPADMESQLVIEEILSRLTLRSTDSVEMHSVDLDEAE